MTLGWNAPIERHAPCYLSRRRLDPDDFLYVVVESVLRSTTSRGST